MLSACFVSAPPPAGAQSSGGKRYIQHEEVATQVFNWGFRVHSVDVFSDRSMRVNLVVTNTGQRSASLAVMDLNYIYLVADGSNERVPARGRPEGISRSTADMGTPGGFVFRFAPDDPTRIAFRFPPFEEQARTVRLVINRNAFAGSLSDSPPSDFVIRNIALFARP